ncbi:MAG: UTRA domain-containing protein [Marinibacterium sp.]
MNKPSLQSWKLIVDEVTRRIADGQWAQGALIPNEADLATEFGCSRSTVNRALRELAGQGVLERRRKAGTRVCEMPQSQARLEIPIVRQQVERRGGAYGYHLLERKDTVPPAAVAALLALRTGQAALHLRSLHTADGRGFVYEDRWINTVATPAAAMVDFATLSANEWLVRNVPFTTGEIGLQAASAGTEEAEILGCHPGEALFAQDRITRDGAHVVTWVRNLYAPGYRMRLSL